MAIAIRRKTKTDLKAASMIASVALVVGAVTYFVGTRLLQDSPQTVERMIAEERRQAELDFMRAGGFRFTDATGTPAHYLVYPDGRKVKLHPKDTAAISPAADSRSTTDTRIARSERLEAVSTSFR